MTLGFMVEPPAHRPGLLVRVRIQVDAGDTVAPTGRGPVEQVARRLRAVMHRRVVAHDEGIADVTFVAVEYRTQVDEEDIVAAQHGAGFRALAECLQRVRTETDDARVPDALHARGVEAFFRQLHGLRLVHARDDARGDVAQRLP